MRMLLSAAALLLALSPGGATAQEIGGNFNGFLFAADQSLVAKSGVRWVRGFVNVPRNFLAFDASGTVTGVEDGNIAQAPDSDSTSSDVLAITTLKNFLAVKSVAVDGAPVKTILSLKLDFKYLNTGVPAAGSAAEGYWLSAIEKLLAADDLGAAVDILVLGNEPMWETPDTDADAYGAFLSALIGAVDDLRTSNQWSFAIFTGALNRAGQLPDNPILKQIVAITGSDARVAGIDLHLHVADVAAAEADVTAVRNALGSGKQIISTEFSLVDLWDAHRTDPLGDWGTANGYPADMPFYQWLNALMQQALAGKPIGGDAFAGYFAAQSWYPQGWFASFVAMLGKYDVTAATYGLVEPTPYPAATLNDKSTLWLLNFAYAGNLLGRGPDGFDNPNPLVASDFAAAVAASAGGP